MNYIKTLQKDLRSADNELRTLNAGLDSLIAYLNGPKFSCGDKLDGYVQINDVLRRIEQSRHIADHARYGV